MNIEFYFYNFGDTVELEVGFQEYSREIAQNSGIKDFRTSINNEIKEFEIINVPAPYDEYTWAPESIYIIFWYVKNVTFKGNDYTVSKVHYKADYSSGYIWDEIVYAVRYLYRTGSTWKDKIDQMNIEIVNHNNFWLLGTFFREKYDYKLERINENTLNIQLKDISPDYYETFSIALVNRNEFDFGFSVDSKEENKRN